MPLSKEEGRKKKEKCGHGDTIIRLYGKLLRSNAEVGRLETLLKKSEKRHKKMKKVLLALRRLDSLIRNSLKL